VLENDGNGRETCRRNDGEIQQSVDLRVTAMRRRRHGGSRLENWHSKLLQINAVTPPYVTRRPAALCVKQAVR